VPAAIAKSHEQKRGDRYKSTADRSQQRSTEVNSGLKVNSGPKDKSGPKVNCWPKVKSGLKVKKCL
jgi:hypothetical protein